MTIIIMTIIIMTIIITTLFIKVTIVIAVTALLLSCSEMKQNKRVPLYIQDKVAVAFFIATPVRRVILDQVAVMVIIQQ